MGIYSKNNILLERIISKIIQKEELLKHSLLSEKGHTFISFCYAEKKISWTKQTRTRISITAHIYPSNVKEKERKKNRFRSKKKIERKKLLYPWGDGTAPKKKEKSIYTWTEKKFGKNDFVSQKKWRKAYFTSPETKKKNPIAKKKTKRQSPFLLPSFHQQNWPLLNSCLLFSGSFFLFFFSIFPNSNEAFWVRVRRRIEKPKRN